MGEINLWTQSLKAWMDSRSCTYLHSMFIHSSNVLQAHISASLSARLWGCGDEQQHEVHSLKELTG